MPATCHLCRRPTGATVYVILGYLGRYVECEWCHESRPRPAEPELITDTFEVNEPARDLDEIFDRLEAACP